MLPSDVQRGFSASGSTTFAEFTDTVCTMLSCPDARLSLEFKLSTDPKTAKWYSLDSPDDWAHAIGRVRHKRAQQKTLGTRAQIPTGHIVNTLRAQATCDFNMPSDQMLGTFWIYPVVWPQYAQWVNSEHILNVPSHVTPMYPVGKQPGTFSMFGKMQSQCAQWANGEYIQNKFSDKT